MVIYSINSKLNSTFGTIGKATGVKITAKAVDKNSNFCVDAARLQDFEQFFLLLNKFLRLSLNGSVLLLNFLAHFFHLVLSIWAFWVLKVNSNLHAGFVHV